MFLVPLGFLLVQGLLHLTRRVALRAASSNMIRIICYIHRSQSAYLLIVRTQRRRVQIYLVCAAMAETESHLHSPQCLPPFITVLPSPLLPLQSGMSGSHGGSGKSDAETMLQCKVCDGDGDRRLCTCGRLMYIRQRLSFGSSACLANV